MDKIFENKFSVLYENNSTSNYLVLRTAGGTLINYQAQMLLNNRISGLPNFNINYIGEEINCFYNITSKCSLSSFMSRKRFSRNEFLVTMLNITNNICNLRNYLLYDHNILLDEKYIFVEPEKSEIFFVYLPFSCCKNDIKAFFMKLMVELVKFNGEDSDNYIQKLLEATKDELFSLANLKLLIENLLGEEIKGQVPTGTDGNVEGVYQIHAEKLASDNVKTKGKQVFPKGTIKNPELPAKSRNKRRENDCFKPVTFYLCQPVLFILFILTVTSNFTRESENPRMTATILIIIFVSVDILIFRMLKEKGNAAEKENINGVLEFISDKMKSRPKPLIPEKTAGEHLKKEIRPPAGNKYKGETEIIKKSEVKEVPCLKELDGDAVIVLDKKSLLIGRMEGFVDYVISNGAVGRIHAEILNENGELYIMDCNSRNGTFLNDSRIMPNTKISMNNSDVVRFANKEFVFHNTESPEGKNSIKEKVLQEGC